MLNADRHFAKRGDIIDRMEQYARVLGQVWMRVLRNEGDLLDVIRILSQ